METGQKESKSAVLSRLSDFSKALTVIIVGSIILMLIGIGIFIAVTVITKPFSPDIKDDVYLKYFVTDSSQTNEKCVRVVGFTYNGLQQETIEIPSEIGGYPVLEMGYTDYDNYPDYEFTSQNLKKLYLYADVDVLDRFGGHEMDLMLCSVRDDFTHLIGSHFSTKNIYYYKSLIDDVSSGYTLKPANVVFMNNYSNEVNGGYYSLDNVNAGELIRKPTDPKRNGYEFNGWYTDEDCKTVWDFSVAPTIGENEEFRLYADWEAV